MIKISEIKIVGNPTVNFIFFVLCLNKYIPKIVPIPPPSIVIISRVPSGILQYPFFALYLSIPIAKKPIKLMTNKYISIFFIEINLINPVLFKKFIFIPFLHENLTFNI